MIFSIQIDVYFNKIVLISKGLKVISFDISFMISSNKFVSYNCLNLLLIFKMTSFSLFVLLYNLTIVPSLFSLVLIADILISSSIFIIGLNGISYDL